MLGTKLARRILAPLTMATAMVFGIGSAASASPVRVAHGDTFSELVASHCGTSDWQSVSFPGRNKNLIYAGETIDITCPGASAPPVPRDSGQTPSSPTSSRGVKIARVISFAKAQLDEPYRLGSAGPNRWDCSGLTMRAFQRIGISLPHKANLQKRYGTPVSRARARAGDLIIFLDKNGYGYHAALYLGDGKMIAAPHTGAVVRIQSVYRGAVFRRLI